MNIEFILNNKFRAKSSCNIFEGNYYVTNADSIIIDSVATTLIYCVNDTVRDWEETYYNHLINAISYQINGNKLTLKTKSRIDIIYRAN